MSRVASATINLSALRHNLSVAKKVAPGVKVMALVKANGYGHGLLTIANALDVEAFAVAHIDEAIELRDSGINNRIVALQGFADAAELRLFIDYEIEPIIHSAWQVEIIEKTTLNQSINIWLKVDTGMHRLGVPIEQFQDLWQRLQVIPVLRNSVNLMTHFANADDPANPSTDAQIKLFQKTISGISAAKTLANSAGLMHWPESHADWIRPGIMLYGASPFKNKSAEELNLKPVMTLKSHVIALNATQKGTSIGYGSSWTAKENTNIGIVGIGYGDGYPRHVAPDTPVLINGRKYPIVGRVSMDMICVDLGCDSNVSVGNEVVLWGEGLPADLIADKAGTIAYELFCQVTSRVRFEVQHGS